MARFDSYIWEQENPVESSITDTLMDLILSLEPEQLDDDQAVMIMDILDELETADKEEMVQEKALATKSTTAERSYFKRYYRSHKKKIRDKINNFNNSGKGKLRKDKIKRLKKVNATPSGRSKVSHRT